MTSETFKQRDIDSYATLVDAFDDLTQQFTTRAVGRLDDAEQLGLDARSADVVLSLYALLHFPNPDRAVEEMWRILKPGDRIAIGIGIGAGPPMTSVLAPGYIMRSLQ